MDKRLKEIFSSIPTCKIFADIGCDHGYMTEQMLKQNKCEKAIISDVSAKCLSKAQNLLKSYIESGRVQAFVSDGFDNVPIADVALIAGMGGEEISKILLKCKTFPNSLVLQPMKNAETVRKTLIDLCYKIERDYVFKVGRRFYVLIVAKKGKDELSEEEIEFGRTNLLEKSQDFLDWVKTELIKTENYLINANISENSKAILEKRKERLIKCIN